MNLDGKVMEVLCQAIVDHFEASDLSRMLRFKLNKKWSQFTTRDGTLDANVFSLVSCAEQEGWLLKLIQGLKDFRSETTFVEICDNLLQRYSEPSNSIKNRGEKAYLTCDRHDPAMEFRNTVIKHKRDNASKNSHFFILEATMDDCPDEFIERIRWVELDYLGQKFPPIGWESNPDAIVIRRSWKVPRTVKPGDVSKQILEEINFDLWSKDKSIASSSKDNLYDTVQELRTRTTGYKAIIINHPIDNTAWRNNFGEQLEGYIKLFNTLPADMPPFFVFFTVTRMSSFSAAAPLLVFNEIRILLTIKKRFANWKKDYPGLCFCDLARLEKISDEQVRDWLHTIEEPNFSEKIQALIEKKRYVRFKDLIELMD